MVHSGEEETSEVNLLPENFRVEKKEIVNLKNLLRRQSSNVIPEPKARKSRKSKINPGEYKPFFAVKSKEVTEETVVKSFDVSIEETELETDDSKIESENESLIIQTPSVKKKTSLLSILNGNSKVKEEEEEEIINILSQETLPDEFDSFLSESEYSNSFLQINKDKNSLLVQMSSPKLKGLNDSDSSLIIKPKINLRKLLSGSKKRKINPHKVKLSIPKEFAQKIAQNWNELEVIPVEEVEIVKVDAKDTNHVFFKEFRRKLESNKSQIKSIKAEKIKQEKLIKMRNLKGFEFHVMPEVESMYGSLPIKKHKKPESLNYNESILKTPISQLSSQKHKKYQAVKTEISKEEFLNNMGLPKSVIAKFEPFLTSPNKSTYQTWGEFTKPKNVRHCLLSQKNHISIWIKESFMLLDKNFQIQARQEYFKKKKTDLDEFIVNDDFEEIDTDQFSHLQTIQDLKDGIPYIPLMIVGGPLGNGKTSTIYACVEELNGHVYEINSNQDHNKKSLQQLLYELATSKAVGKSKFQQGIILLENVDILFQVEDRGFWELIGAIVPITRKPIIMTCSNPEQVPDSLLKICELQNTLIETKKIENNILENYLKLICGSFGYFIEPLIIKNIINARKNDLRGCINDLEYLCDSLQTKIDIIELNDDELLKLLKIEISNDELIQRKTEITKQTNNLPTNINKAAFFLEINSVSDILSHNLKSLNTNTKEEFEINENEQINYDEKIEFDNELQQNTKNIKDISLTPNQFNMGFSIRNRISAFLNPYKFEFGLNNELINIVNPINYEEETFYFDKFHPKKLKSVYFNQYLNFLNSKINYNFNTRHQKRNLLKLFQNCEVFPNNQQLKIFNSLLSPSLINLEIGPFLRIFAILNDFLKKKNLILYNKGIAASCLKPIKFNYILNDEFLNTSCLNSNNLVKEVLKIHGVNDCQH